MSSMRGKKDERLYRRVVLQEKCLALVLRKEKKEEHYRIGEVKGIPKPNKLSQEKNFAYEGGYIVFQDFQRENQGCYWSQKLADAATKMSYRGFLLPSTLLISGSDVCLEVIRSAWSRKVLRSPPGYVIKRLGDLNTMEMTVLPQTHFTPLAEALCLVVGQLNDKRQTAAIPSIKKYLLAQFPDMYIPSAELLHKALGTLIKERKLYHTGEGYFVVTPQTFKVRSTSPPSPERQMLMTNDEAIELMHGPGKSKKPYCTRAIQTGFKDGSYEDNIYDRIITPSTTYQVESDHEMISRPARIERSLSLRILRSKDNRHESSSSSMLSRSNSCRLSPDKAKSLLENINLKNNPAHKTVDKGEKVSILTKLFRRASLRRIRGRSKSPGGSRATFSAQFPPNEWCDPDFIHFHSRGTQTLSRDKKVRSKSLCRERRHSEKSQTLGTRQTHTNFENHTSRTSPRHYASRSSTLPRKSFTNNPNALRENISQDSYSTNGSLKSHSLPSSSISSPKASPRMRKNKNSSSRLASPARSRSTLERRTEKLNNKLPIAKDGKEKEPSSAINNIIRGYRPTAFSSVRREDNRSDVPDTLNLVANGELKESHVKSELKHKLNLEQSEFANSKSNFLKSKNMMNDEPLDFEVEFKSRTAQRILQGISDSVDTLADLNNCDNDNGAGSKGFGRSAKVKAMMEWNSTYLNNNKNFRNQQNNSSENFIHDFEHKLCTSKSSYCMSHEKFSSVMPRKITSVSAGSTPIFETAA